jgi:hypothetical protein
VLNMWVAVPGDMGGCCWEALLSATLRGKDGGLGFASNGGGGSLVWTGEEWRVDDAGDSFDRLSEALDIS